MCVCERESVCVCERERVCVCVCVCVCESERERERERECVSVKERERERVCFQSCFRCLETKIYLHNYSRYERFIHFCHLCGNGINLVLLYIISPLLSASLHKFELPRTTYPTDFCALCGARQSL